MYHGQSNGLLSRLLGSFLCLMLPLWADQIISAPQTTPIVSNGGENILVTPSGAVEISPAGHNNYALRLTGPLQAGKSIVNQGRITSAIDGSGGTWSLTLLLFTTSHGTILNQGTIRSTVSENQWAYPLYLSRNASDGEVINRGTVESLSGDNSYGVALHIRTNEGRVLNDQGGTLFVRGGSGTWTYGIAVIRNRPGGEIINRGQIHTLNTGTGGGGTGIYTQYNDGEILNEGPILVEGTGTGAYAYGIGVNHNYGVIRNRSVIRVANPSGVEHWAFHTDDGNGTVINDSGAEAYGDIHTAGQLFENRGRLMLYSTGVSMSRVYHGFGGSVLGVKVDLDNTHTAVYSMLETRGTILEDSTTIDVDILSALSDQHYLLTQRLESVIDTENNLTVHGTVQVTDNSALINYRAEYDADNLDLVPYRARTISDAVAGGDCAAGARGLATILEDYPFGSDGDLDRFVNSLYALPSVDAVANALQSAIPYAVLQGLVADRELSAKLLTRLAAHADPWEEREAEEGFWIEGWRMRQKMGCRNGYRGYDGDSSIFMLGYDRPWGESMRLGVAWGVGEGEVRTRGASSRRSGQRYDLMLYGTWRPSEGEWGVSFETGLGWLQNTESHEIASLGREGKARYHEWVAYGRLDLLRRWHLSEGWSLRGRTSLEYFRGSTSGIDEQGAGGSDVTLEDASLHSLRVALGGELRYAWKDETRFSLRGSVDYPLLDESMNVDGALRGYPGHTFPVRLDYGSSPGYRLDLSLRKKLGKGFAFTVEAGIGGRSSSYRDWGFSAGISRHF
ncbi:autotransporter outer membrane beta-barrel domain-containing protein [Nitratifractor sp.]